MDTVTSAEPVGDPIGSAPRPAAPAWTRIGTVVGNASTGEFKFILRNLQAKVGDIVATRVEVPTGAQGQKRTGTATVWGRIVSIDRFNPFFPAEAAQELANEDIRFLDTVLSESRDHLEAEVLILGTTMGDDPGRTAMSPLTYPVKPSAEVLYPSADSVRLLLTGRDDAAKEPKLVIGSLIARNDVEVSLGARQVVSRHLAILAMTGGGKTVAARRIIRELIDLNYPLVIFDPHGDYLGFYEQQGSIPGLTVKVFYPSIEVTPETIDVIGNLIEKMGQKLTSPQQDYYNSCISYALPPPGGEPAVRYLDRLIGYAEGIRGKKARKEEVPEEAASIGTATIGAVIRSLKFVRSNLVQMERNNEQLRSREKFIKAGFVFEPMPSPTDAPEDIVKPGQVSIFYLAGYDHLNQSAILSLTMEALFAHRATLTDRIPPFQAVIEEAHNFIPSRQEGTDSTPSLATLRKVITEGRKFGTGLIIISQRPSRLDETTLSQCNSFLVLRLVNPKDKSFVRSVMENLTEQDANVLQTFGPGQGIVSGQAVRFPLLVKVKDDELRSSTITDEDFINDVKNWTPNATQRANAETMARLRPAASSRGEPDDADARAPAQARASKPVVRRPLPSRRPSRTGGVKADI